jgi:manganese transport protein
VLSIALPLPMIALVVFTRRFDVMGEFANSQLTDLTAWVATALVVFLNVILLLEAMGA